MSVIHMFFYVSVLQWSGRHWPSLCSLTLNLRKRAAQRPRAQSVQSPPPSSTSLARWLRQLRTSTAFWSSETRSCVKVRSPPPIYHWHKHDWNISRWIYIRDLNVWLDTSAQVDPREQTWTCLRCLLGRVLTCVQRRRGSWGKHGNSWAYLRSSQILRW